MSNALIPVNELQQLAGMLSKSSLLPPDLRGKEADIAVTVMAGRELGLSPMAALRSIYVVKGRPVLSADAMVGLVLSSGAAEYFTCVESTNVIATYETKRKGSPMPQRLSFTVEQAKRAGLTGGNWQSYPEAMLRARAKAALARDVYPDALAGCYTEDEVVDDRAAPRRQSDNDVIDAEIVEKPQLAAAPPPANPDDLALELVADLKGCTTPDQVRALASRFNALPKGTRARAAAHKAYSERLAEVSPPQEQAS